MKIKFCQILFVGLLFIGVSEILSQQTVNFVTYGADGNPKEGDNDFKQLFFIQVDENSSDSLILELFDIDCFGENDQAFNLNFNSEFKFSLFGGEKAYSVKSITSESPSSKDLYKGKLLKELFVSNETQYDNNWFPFASLKKNEGEFVNGAYYFKLLVEGISGDDANVFNVRTISENNDVIKILNYAPTVHLLPQMDPIQLRFNSGENSRVIVKNYDADGAQLSLKTPYRSGLKLKSSDDGNSKSDLVNLLAFEKNEICAIQFGPGGKAANDAIFLIKDETGNPIPITLPITTKAPNTRPVIRKSVVQSQECNSFVLDASDSKDFENEKISVKWIFPDGIITEGFKEEVTFSNAGKHPIILAINDNSNSIESGSYQEFNITINELPKAIASDDILRAPNEKINFTGELSYDPDGWIKTYDWDFGDGNSGSGKNTSHVYNKHGLYNIRLTVTDNFDGECNTNVDSFNVWINASPVANAGDDIHCSINEIINFDGSKSNDSDGHLISYEWNFADGVKEGDKIVSHSFNKAGKYNVTLKVTDNSAVKNNISVDKMIVWVNNPPIAKAGKDIEIAVDELLTLDAGNSIDKDGEIAEFVWSSANQFEKLEKVVTHKFSSPGKYEVKLKVKDNSGTKTEYDDDVMIVTVNAQPIANAGVDVFQTNASVIFDASKSTDTDGEITKYHWNFGNGSTSNRRNVEHFYKSSGKYKVALEVEDNSPASNNKATSEIKVVINAKPIADSGPDQIVAPGEAMNLSAKNSSDIDGTIVLTEWLLENKIISNEKDFNYSLDKPGSYNVQLRVMDNSKHTDAIDYDNLTIVVNEAPTIITKDYYKIAVGESINFDATKSFDTDGSIEKYEWSLDNKALSNSSKFTYKFDEIGKYVINLLTTDNSSVNNSTSKKSILVFVNSSPTIKYISDINSCNNSITLSAGESFDRDGDVLSFTWDLGDGTLADGKEITHNYNSVGSYPIILIADDGHGLSNSIATTQVKVKINSAPIANAGMDEIICTGDIVTLDASESFDADGDLLKYEWDFGDSSTSSGITVNKNYILPGLYIVKLKVSDNSGLECNYSYDTKILKVVESPVAFAGENIITCSGKEVFFNAYKSTDSDGIVNSFAWDFGDGSVGGGEKTSHVYKVAGVFNVLLSITGEQTGECDNTDTDELIVSVEEAPLAEFTYQDSVAVNTDIEFNALLSDGRGNEITSYNWNLGDGSSAVGKKITHNFSKYGNYIVELTINTDSKSGCNSSTIKKTVYVNEKPVAIAEGELFANINEVLKFDASKSYDPNGVLTEYLWNFGAGTSKEGVNVSHSFNKPGNYKVSLTVKDETNLSNSSATHELIIEVNSLPTGKIELPDFGFVGNPISISGKGINDVDGKIKSVVWLVGECEDSTSAEVEHTFTKAGKHNVMYEITDDKNATTQVTKSIMIYELPTLTLSAPSVTCINEKVKLEASYTTDNSKIKIPIEWHFANGDIGKGRYVEKAFNKSGNNKVEIILQNPLDNSIVLLKKEIEIYVNQSPVAKISDIGDTFIGGANDNVLFDATESYDPDSNSLTYHWNMGDGNKYDGVKIFHSYLNAGNYKITLTVSDNKDCKCSESVVSKTIKVVDRK
ncbi:MAG: PKD domain-containing protein [Bacteroidales bacterium]|nr:PKD domain-containing protein [Bacteroidales bacterium]